MAYVPDPTDVTQPTDAIIAETAQAEFRALKAYLQTLVLGAAGVKAPVRQTVIAALIAASTGAPAFLAAGVGLNVSVLASTFPVISTIANGFDVNGPANLITQVSADNVAAYLCPANNRNYLSYDMLTNITGTYTQSLAPPLYEVAYPQGVASLLSFGSLVGTNIFLDDFGPTWTANAGAKNQNNHSFYGVLNALGGGGGANALNGTTDFVKSAASVFTINGSRWSARVPVYFTALPGAATSAIIYCNMTGGGGGSKGFTLECFNNAGVIHFRSNLGNAAISDIGTLTGTSVPVINTPYYLEICYDNGTYRLYVNGVQEASLVSAVNVSLAGNSMYVGGYPNGGGFVSTTGYVGQAEFSNYCPHSAGAGYAVPAAAPSISAAGYASDWFSINEMKMYQCSGPSLVAGNGPAFTRVNRVYWGEATSTGGGFAAGNPIAYALQGQYISTPVVVQAASTPLPFSHNLGCKPRVLSIELISMSAEAGYLLGQRVTPVNSNLISPLGAANELLVNSVTGAALFTIPNATTGALVNISGAGAWTQEIRASRGWGGA